MTKTISEFHGDDVWRDEDGVIWVRQEQLTDLADRLAPRHFAEDDKLRIYLNRNLDWTPNKRAAHAVHAALLALGIHPGTKVVVLDKGPTEIAKMATVVHDAGHTELEPGTLTAGTNWPKDSEP